MDFVALDEEEFTYGAVAPVAPGVQRVIAENPSKFTYRGTGTYIVGDRDVAVIDPGPQLDSHREALAAALKGRTVRSILVTHCHADHSPLATWLAAETGSPTYAYGSHAGAGKAWDIGSLPDDFGRAPESGSASKEVATAATEPPVEEATDTDFVPDAVVRTGDVVFTCPGLEMRALHTPGHTSNHTCFALASKDAGHLLFTGDHVMGWSTTVVSPPDGDMGAYMASLRAVAGRDDDVAIPTHGAPITNPMRYVTQLVDHRVERERQVLDAVRRGLATIPEMVGELYADVRVELHRPAAASVLAHLVKLGDDGLTVTTDGRRPRLDSVFAAT